MKPMAWIAVALLAVGAAFVAGMLVERNSSDTSAFAVWTGTSETPFVLTKYDNRPIVAVDDGDTGTIDDWEVTAGFRETTAPYGYGKRRLDFDVRISWTGQSPPGEMMGYTFLEGAMLFVSPSGRAAEVALRGDFSDGFEGIAYNGSVSLPDEPGTFYLTFGPHPHKHRLVWSVDLPYLS